MTEAPMPADRWRQALQELTRDSRSAAEWRFSRYTFAYRLGAALAKDPETGGVITGPVVYGIWLNWGLIYIGQTGEADRRLRDLPVGESHHLANTFPPEIWSRVVVLPWPRLPPARAAIERMPQEDAGLGLEYGLQSLLSPLANASRRTPAGSWRAVDWTSSRSRGARAYQQLGELFSTVKDVWARAACCDPATIRYREAVTSSSRPNYSSSTLRTTNDLWTLMGGAAESRCDGPPRS
jgi:hypothetical protein